MSKKHLASVAASVALLVLGAQPSAGASVLPPPPIRTPSVTDAGVAAADLLAKATALEPHLPDELQGHLPDTPIGFEVTQLTAEHAAGIAARVPLVGGLGVPERTVVAHGPQATVLDVYGSDTELTYVLSLVPTEPDGGGRYVPNVLTSHGRLEPDGDVVTTSTTYDGATTTTSVPLALAPATGCDTACGVANIIFSQGPSLACPLTVVGVILCTMVFTPLGYEAEYWCYQFNNDCTPAYGFSARFEWNDFYCAIDQCRISGDAVDTGPVIQTTGAVTWQDTINRRGWTTLYPNSDTYHWQRWAKLVDTTTKVERWGVQLSAIGYNDAISSLRVTCSDYITGYGNVWWHNNVTGGTDVDTAQFSYVKTSANYYDARCATA